MSKVWKCSECVKHGTDGCYNGSRFEDNNCKYMLIDIDYAYEQGRADERAKLFEKLKSINAHFFAIDGEFYFKARDILEIFEVN